jgi:hypothetical protein
MAQGKLASPQENLYNFVLSYLGGVLWNRFAIDLSPILVLLK